MTAYYLAARFSRHAEMREYRAELAKYGNTVTSRWIDLHGGDQLESAAQSVLNTDPGSVAHFGANDLADIEAADALISFTSDDGGMDLRTAVTEIPLLPTPAAERGGRNKSASEGAAIRWGLDYIDRLLPTPTSRGSKNAGDPERTDARMSERGQPLSEVAVNVLMPTPRATDGTKGGPNQRGSSGDLMLPSAVNLLPTPTAMDSKASGASGYDSGHDGTTLTDAAVRQPARWGEYEPAIRRWETVLGRPAPAPTMTSSKGNPQLSPRFTEWLMGLPDGWITDVPGVTRNEALKACGNGVVPQQCEAALRWLLAAYYEAVAA